jgi:hypothetical protein
MRSVQIVVVIEEVRAFLATQSSVPVLGVFSGGR